MTDLMVDTETTGVDAARNGIIQLSGIKFNYETGEIGSMFDRCPSLLSFRHWNLDTKDFWMVKNREVYVSIVMREEPAQQVFQDFCSWVNEDAPDGGYRFWAKPTTFDWNFVESHIAQCGLPMPFHYRYARDLNSFLAALNGTANHSSVEDQVPFPANGKKHNALHDAAWQIDQLMFAKANSCMVETVRN